MYLSDSDLRRFWSKVALPDANGCMLWLGDGVPFGYGHFMVRGSYHPSHRISLWTAVGEPKAPDLQAAHACRSRDCVAPEHLRWATGKENMQDRHRDGTVNHGERNGQAVLTSDEVREIRRRYALGGITQRELGAEFGVSPQAIGHIVTRRKWAHLESAS